MAAAVISNFIFVQYFGMYEVCVWDR